MEHSSYAYFLGFQEGREDRRIDWCRSRQAQGKLSFTQLVLRDGPDVPLFQLQALIEQAAASA